jgi:hypothetical protein
MSEEQRTAAAMTMPRYEEYVGTIRELWDAFNRADYEATVALTHPEIEMQDHPTLPDAEWHHAPDAAARVDSEKSSKRSGRSESSLRSSSPSRVTRWS